MSPAAKRIQVCDVKDVEAGTAIRVAIEELVLAVFNIDGAFFVADDQCTHGPGSLSEGTIDGEVIECNFHGGAFDIRTGAVVQPPCMIPLRVYATAVEDGKVVITV